MGLSTTELTSKELIADNPIHQRQVYAYQRAAEHISGRLLDIGCGSGRGIEYLLPKCEQYIGIDKFDSLTEHIKEEKKASFQSMVFPPMKFEENSFDSIGTFQVIEHVEDDSLFVKECHRMLKPGGTAVITTPNIKMSLTRNPWHVREYTVKELQHLLEQYFPEVEMFGIYGNKKVDDYYQANKAGVQKFKKLDIFNLEYKLPRSVLRIPYDFLNRMNRNKIKDAATEVTASIGLADFSLKAADDFCYDLYAVVKK